MTIIQHKRGTSERWAELNPVLSEGEIGYDTTVKKAKIGDGVTAWVDLPFMAGGGSEPVDAYTKAETDDLLATKANVTDLSTKQDTLVSGTNIKTINGVTLLGEGNIDVSGGAGGASIDDATTSSTSVWSSEKVNSEISAVSTELGITKTDVQNLQSEVVNAQGDIASLDADVSTLNGVVASHTTSISSINDSISMAQTDILDLKENKQEKISDSATISVSTGSIGGVIPASSYELYGNAVVNSETNELTGTNANSYLKLPEPFRPGENDSWEIQAAFICKSMAGEYILNPIFNEYDTNKSVPQLYCYREYLAADISFDGSTWGIEEWGANVSEMNCSNSVMNLGRLSYDASTKTLTLSLSKDDGVTWASLTQTVSGQIFSSASSTYIIGADNRTTGHGQINPIYLNKTWIKINGEYWWHPFPIEQEATATTANVKISAREGNAITQEVDGLFVNQSASGASNYNDLTNKPTINGVELSNNVLSSTINVSDRFTPDNPIHFDTVRVSNYNGLAYNEGTLKNTINTLNCLGGTGYVSYGSDTAGAVTFDIDGNYFNSSLYLDIPISQGECLFFINPPFDTANNAGYQYIFGNKNSNGYLKPIVSFGEGTGGYGQQIGDNCTLSVRDNKYMVVTGNVLSAVTTPALDYDSTFSGGSAIIEFVNSSIRNTYQYGSKAKYTRIVNIDSVPTINEINTLRVIVFKANGVVNLTKIRKSPISALFSNITECVASYNSSTQVDLEPKDDLYMKLKVDGTTIKTNSNGELEAIAPANMITTDNIASDATISTMSGNITTLTENMGGMKLVKIAQTDYDALATKDENTLYIVIGDTSTTMYIGSVQIQ